MVGDAPQGVQPQMQEGVRHRPGAAEQQGDQFAQGQVVALDSRGLNLAAQPLGRPEKML